MRADKLEFNISYSDSAYPENASKLRVFCYMKNGGYAFGDEFEDKYSATFDSNRTSKYSGYGTITIQLLDAEENLINSANVVCKIIESNSTTPFITSPDFTEQSKQEAQAIVDNGKAQIIEATEKAKEQIDGWTDQTSRIAKNESNISDLQHFKANTGALHFNGGILSTADGSIKSLPLEFSIAFRLKITKEGWESIPTTTYKNFIGFPISGYSAGHFGFSIKRVAQGIAIEWRSGYDATTQSGIGGSSTFFIDNLADYFKGNWVNMIFSVSKDSDSKYYAYLYFDGKQIGRVVLSGWTGVSAVSYPFKINGDRTNVVTTTAPFSIADIFIFNFDITSADAPYTIADYQQGKPIPPSITQGVGFAINDNFGAGGWTSGATSSGNWYKGNYVKYIADHTIDNIDTESGITEAVDLSTSQVPGATLADVCLYNKSFSFKNHAGKRVKIKGSYKVRPLIDLGTNNAPVVSFGIARKSWSGYVQLNELPYNQWSTIEFDDYIDVPTTDAVYFGIGAKYDSTTQPVVAIADINIKVVETILALEDYTIKNGTSQIVFDYSGNGNDATITGIVKGDNDNRVQKLVDFITTLS